MLMYFPQFRGLDVGNGQRPCGRAEGLGHAPTPHGSGVSADTGPTSSSHVARTPQHLQTPSLWVVGRSLGTGDTASGVRRI